MRVCPLILISLVVGTSVADVAAGAGVCDFERFKPYGSIGNNYGYCPPAPHSLTNSRARLRKALGLYQKAENLLSALETEKAATDEDKENLLYGKEKVAICEEKLNGESQ